MSHVSLQNPRLRDICSIVSVQIGLHPFRLTLSDDTVDDSCFVDRSIDRRRSRDDTVDDSGLVDLDLDGSGSSDDAVDDSSIIDGGLNGSGGESGSEGVHCRGFESVGWLVGR